MASSINHKESDSPRKRRKFPLSLPEVASTKELHHHLPALLSKTNVNEPYYSFHYGRTALLMALIEGCSLETFNVLRAAGADFGISDRYGYNALHCALLGDCSNDVVDQVLRYDHDLLYNENKRLKTPLYVAAEKKRFDHFLPTILQDQKRNFRDSEGMTPILLALYGNCSLETFDVLRAAGADMRVTDLKGDNALHFALLGDCSNDVVDQLLRYDHDLLYQENKRRKTPLYVAAEKKRFDHFLPTILQDQKINFRDSEGMTPILLALYGNCSLETFNVLRAAGADMRVTNRHGDNALHYALDGGCSYEVIDAILQFMSPALLNETDEEGNTYLHFAIQNGCSSEIIRALLNAGLNPAAKNEDGDNALHILMHFTDAFDQLKQCLSVLEELLRGHPKIVGDRNNDGKLPLECGYFRESEAIISTLKWMLLQNDAGFQWRTLFSNAPEEDIVSLVTDCNSDLDQFRAYMVTDTLSLYDLVKSCYVSPKFIHELRVEKRFVRVLQFQGNLRVYEDEVMEIVRMVRVCSSLYGRTLPFPTFKNGNYVYLSEKVLDYLNIDDLEQLSVAVNTTSTS